MRLAASSFVLTLCLSLLPGCGQTGPLYFPADPGIEGEDAAPAVVAPVPEPSPNSIDS